jgi:hypothetical protein
MDPPLKELELHNSMSDNVEDLLPGALTTGVRQYLDITMQAIRIAQRRNIHAPESLAIWIEQQQPPPQSLTGLADILLSTSLSVQHQQVLQASCGMEPADLRSWRDAVVATAHLEQNVNLLREAGVFLTDDAFFDWLYRGNFATVGDLLDGLSQLRDLRKQIITPDGRVNTVPLPGITAEEICVAVDAIRAIVANVWTFAGDDEIESIWQNTTSLRCPVEGCIGFLEERIARRHTKMAGTSFFACSQFPHTGCRGTVYQEKNEERHGEASLGAEPVIVGPSAQGKSC